MLEEIELSAFRQISEDLLVLKRFLLDFSETASGALIKKIRYDVSNRKQLKKGLQKVRCFKSFLGQELSFLESLFPKIDWKTYQFKAERYANLLGELQGIELDYSSLKKLIKEEKLVEGIHAIHHDLNKTIQKGLSSKQSKKNRRAALTSLQILTRTCAKTIPFSTLGTVGLESLSIAKQITTKANRQVLEILVNAIRTKAAAWMLFPIKINPNLVQQAGETLFWHKAEDGAESIQAIELEELQSLLNLVDGQKSYQELVVELLSQSGVEASDVRYKLLQLLEVGLLQVYFPDGEDWMCQILEILPQEEYPFLQNALNKLQEAAQQFDQKSQSSISELLGHSLAKEFKVDEKSIAIPPHFLLYKDVFNQEQFLSEKQKENLQKGIEELECFFAFLEKNKPRQAVLLNCWNQHFESEEEVHLLDFFACFEFGEYEIKPVESLEILRVEEGLRLQLPEYKTNDNKIQRAAFIQCTEDGIVLNENAIGYGKMYGRIADDLPVEVLQTQRKWNRNETVLLAEIQSTSYFNPNQHPEMMDYCLRLNGEKGNISLSELFVQKQEGEIVLIHQPSKKQVFLFDLGIQASWERSAFYQFLKYFQANHRIDWMATLEAQYYRFEEKKGEAVFYLPRLNLEHCILKRASWVFIRKHFPKKKVNQNRLLYWFEVKQFFKKYNLPKHVFLCTNGKPQYLDLSKDWAYLLLENALVNNQVFSLEEMLPAPRQMLQDKEGKRYATEFLVQWRNGTL